MDKLKLYSNTPFYTVCLKNRTDTINIHNVDELRMPQRDLIHRRFSIDYDKNVFKSA